VVLVLTAPPYGLDKRLSSGGGQHKYSQFRLLYCDQGWDKKVTDEYFVHIFRVSINQIIFGGNYYSLPPTRGIICWDKQQMMPTFSRWEYVWTNFDMPSKMYELRNGEDLRIHPTQKPLKLFKQILKDFSNPGHLILDPFLGSGTTAVAAYELGRRFIGIEKEQAYCDIANRRIAAVMNQGHLFREPQ